MIAKLASEQRIPIMRNRKDPIFDIERAYADCHRIVLSLVNGEPCGRALDLGAGQGALSQALKERGFEVTAADVNAEQFRAAGVEFAKLDLNKLLPFPDQSFNVVLAVEILEHLEAPRAVVREIFRILKPGGLAVVTTPNITSIPSRILFLATSFFDLYVPTKKRLKDPFSSEADGHISLLPGWLVRYFLKDAGFEIKKTRYTMAYLPLVPRAFLWFFRGPLLGRCGINAVRKPAGP